MIRLRKLVGLVLLMGWIVFYALLAAAIGDAKLATAGTAWRFVYFTVAGIAWTPVAAAILWWSFRLGTRNERR